MTRRDVIRVLERMTRDAESQQALAAQLKVSPQYLSDVLAGRREPGQKILHALGLKREVQYVREAIP